MFPLLYEYQEEKKAIIEITPEMYLPLAIIVASVIIAIGIALSK
ncbi:MAG: hypothetical protein QXW83_04420 [Nitrososphaerales archaeon]